MRLTGQEAVRAAENLASHLWPTRFVTARVGAHALTPAVWFGYVTSGNREVLAKVEDTKRVRASVRLLLWVCEAMAQHCRVELGEPQPKPVREPGEDG